MSWIGVKLNKKSPLHDIIFVLFEVYSEVEHKTQAGDLLDNFPFTSQNVNEKDGRMSPLHFATKHGFVMVNGKHINDLEQVKKCIIDLVNAGAQLNEKGDNGNTPLHFLAQSAPCKEVTEMIDFLKEKGANQTVRNNDQKTYDYYLSL